MPVPSHAVTAEMLEGWGFPVRVVDKIVGTKVVMREGFEFGAAVFAAWPEFVTIATVAPKIVPNPVQSPESIADAIAWVATHKREVVRA